jgi:hypothetical protein
MTAGPDIARSRLYAVVLAFTVLGYTWVAWSLAAGPGPPPGDRALPSPCIFKAATGLPCPSCGTTRAIAALAGGDVGGSLLWNPFGLLVALGAIVIPPWVLADLLRARDGFHRLYLSAERALGRSRPLAFACAALVLANWGWNVIKGF